MTQGSKYSPTSEDKLFVVNCVMAGRSFDSISGCLNICVNTFKKHFRYEIQVSLDTLCGNAAKCISEAVEAGNVDAAKFVLSRKAGWSENIKHDGEIIVKPFDVSDCTDEELEKLQKLSNQLSRKNTGSHSES